MASAGRCDASTWEELLSASAEELWAWSLDAERLSGADLRKIKHARELARDLRIAAGLFDVVPWERVQGLVDAAHALLESGGDVLQAPADPEEGGAGWAPRRCLTARQLASLVPDDDTDEPTAPGVPPEVFRRYLASLSM
jgi:hypothetical protein